MRASHLLFALAVLAAPRLVLADDFAARDTLLVDSAAVPQAGTLRLSAGGGGATSQATVAGNATGNVGASVLYSVLPGLALQFSGYVDNSGSLSPAASVRYQFLNQENHGVNMAALVRYKSVGFNPKSAEVEASLNAGRTFGRFDLFANAVFGKGIKGDTGADVEGKLSGGYHFTQSFRLGADARMQAEVEDEEAGAAPKVGREYDLMAGPSASLVWEKLQFQLMGGVAQPKGTNATGAAALGLVSMDF